MCDRLDRYDRFCSCLLALVKAPDFARVADSVIGSLYKGPGQISIAVLSIANFLLLAVA